MLCVSNLMVLLDLTIVNVSLPHIAGNLAVSPDQGAWTITSYAVAEAVGVPLTGWLAQRFGAVRTFLVGIGGFGLFSLLCGLSTTLEMLVACRIGQGLCGGPIMPLTQALIMRVIPEQSRTGALAVWAMTLGIAPALGPLIGGIITDTVSWHWLFLINVPIAVGGVVFGMALLREHENETLRVPIDAIGLFLLIFWIGSLQLMLDLGRDRDWFEDAWIVSLAVMAAIGLAAFLVWELTEEHPIVDLRVFRHRGFTMGVVAMGLCFASYFSSIVLVPLWLQTSLGYTGVLAGVASSIHAYIGVLMGRVVVKLMAWVDARMLVSMGMLWMAGITVWRAQWTTQVGLFEILLPSAMMGFGVPFMFIPLTGMAMTSVRPEEAETAAGLQNFVRTTAIAFGATISLTLWFSAQSVARSELVGKLQPQAASEALAASGMSAESSRQVISSIVQQEAVTLSVNNMFYLLAFLFALAALLVWMVPRPNLASIGAKGAAGH